MASKDRFFSILAHDLRGPVSSLSVFSDQLISSIDSLERSELLEYLNVIKSTSRGLTDLLENLLLWAGFQINRVKFNKVEVNLFDVVQSVEILSQAALQHKNISFENNVPAHFRVLADFDMVNTIFRNLVSNAIKFSPLGGKIEITAEEDNKSVLVSVKDDGIGISEEAMKKIFRIDEQYTSKGTDGEKGTGLGLLICQEMIHKNGGEIWAESIPGNSTIFSFTLPAV